MEAGGGHLPYVLHHAHAGGGKGQDRGKNAAQNGTISASARRHSKMAPRRGPRAAVYRRPRSALTAGQARGGQPRVPREAPPIVPRTRNGAFPQRRCGRGGVLVSVCGMRQALLLGVSRPSIMFFFFLLIEDSDLASAQLLSLDAFLLRLHCDGCSSDVRWQSLCL